MVNEQEGYAILERVAVPMDMLKEIAKQGFSVDYDYENGEYLYRPKDTVQDIKMISGHSLIANQVAYRMKKGNK